MSAGVYDGSIVSHFRAWMDCHCPATKIGTVVNGFGV